MIILNKIDYQTYENVKKLFIHLTKFISLNYTNAKQFEGKKRQVPSHMHLEQNSKWTKSQKVYFNWEIF
jgi:hypothetical protein